MLAVAVAETKQRATTILKESRPTDGPLLQTLKPCIYSRSSSVKDGYTEYTAVFICMAFKPVEGLDEPIYDKICNLWEQQALHQ